MNGRQVQSKSLKTDPGVFVRVCKNRSYFDRFRKHVGWFFLKRKWQDIHM